MIRFFITLVVSWSISSWVLSEALYFFPQAEPVVTDVQEFVTIPTHDKWDFKRVDREAFQIVSRLKQTPFYHLFPDGSVERFFLGKNAVVASSRANGPIVWDDFSSNSGAELFQYVSF